MLLTLKNMFIGNKAFYKMVLMIAIPIMIQNGITNFVNLLDNIMVGRIGTEQMSGVSIVNQLFFVYNLTVFGGLAGAGIFTAQFYGHGDEEGIRQTFRFKILMGILLTIAAILICAFGGDTLIQLYLNGDNSAGDLTAALMYGKQYLSIMILGLPAFMMVQVYASTLRECGETMLPMKAGIVAVAINLLFNYLLIYGKFGFPELGVSGAAIATVLSRYVEVFIVMIGAHKNKTRFPYMYGCYCTLKVPVTLLKQIIIKGMPLLVNEALWSGGMAMLLQCYSVRGLGVVAALNITNTLVNLFNVIYIALGDSVAIIVGQLLGAGNMKKAKETDTKLIFFATASCLLVGFLLAITASLFPHFYNTTGDVKQLATHLLLVNACVMPIHGFLHATYFTLRSGGKTLITFIFDSGFVWLVNVPLAFVLSRYTTLSIVAVYAIVLLSEIIKCIIGFILVKKDVWMQNIVTE